MSRQITKQHNVVTDMYLLLRCRLRIWGTFLGGDDR